MKRIIKNLLCLILCAGIILLVGAFAAEHMPENPLSGITSTTKKSTLESVKTGIDSALAQIRTVIDSKKVGD